MHASSLRNSLTEKPQNKPNNTKARASTRTFQAYRLKERLPSSVDFSDLSAIGTEVLIKLARRYDEVLNDSFWGYAKKRVYGSMLDYLRSLDILSRASRKLVKSIEWSPCTSKGTNISPETHRLAGVLHILPPG